MSQSNKSGSLELRGIVKRYRDGREERTVLDHVDLCVRPGEFAVVLGPSGSGKSTLLTIAGLLLSPDEGEVLIGESAMGGLSQRRRTAARRDHIGFVFQNHQLLPYLRAVDQVDVAAAHRDPERATQLLGDLGIRDVRQYPATMSGGERQRVAIARAFANDPEVILADEPTASLDAQRGRQVVGIIGEQVHAQGKAALMVTHDERVLDLVDTVYVLEDGALRRR